MERISLKDFVSITLKDIKEGTMEGFTIQGPIEFEVSVMASKGESGRVDIRVVDNSDISREQKNQIEQIQKLKFQIFNKDDFELAKKRADAKFSLDENSRRWSVGYESAPIK